MPTARTLSLALATLTTGLAAGFFYAYACSVTLGLARVGDAEYVSVMQAINATVRNGVFAVSFFGALLCLLAAVALHGAPWRTRRGRLIAVALLAYGIGCFALTLGISVPLNNELARVPADAGAQALATARADYEATWNLFNGIRAAFATVAFAALVAAWGLRPAAARRPSAIASGGHFVASR